MYAYPIDINREPKKVRYQKEVDLSDNDLTLSVLREHIKEDETFFISEVDTGRFSSTTMLYIRGERLETPEETWGTRFKYVHERRKGKNYLRRTLWSDFGSRYIL